MNDEAIEVAQAGYIGWKGWDAANGFGVCDQPTTAYFNAELDASGIQVLPGMNVLELGFGNGQFSAFCRDQNLQYVGTEIDPALIQNANNAGFRALDARDALETLHQEGAVFELVVAFDVFEHLDVDVLIQTLNEIRRILRPRGKVLFRVPSGDSPFARAIQHGDLTHRTILGSSAVTQLAEITGFRAHEIREPAFVYRGLRVSNLVRRLFIQSFRRFSFPLMQAAYFSGAKVVLTQNLVACFGMSSQSND